MIDSDVLDRVLNEARCHGAGFGEVYAEDRRNTGVAYDDGRVDGVSSGRDRGAGVFTIPAGGLPDSGGSAYLDR